MPVIVYKTLTVELFYAQGRRIHCERCQQPFCYIVGGVESAQTTGLPLVSNDDGMRQTAINQAISGLRKTAKKRKVGEAMCPHCQSYQGWMVTNSHLSNMGCFALLGLVLLAIVVAILNGIFQWTDEWLMLIGGSLVVGGLLGLIAGKFLAISAGPHLDKQDSRSMTDDEFRDFLAKCDQHDADPFLLWWISLGNEPGDKQAPVGLGLEDQTGQPVYPLDMSTDHVLARVR